MGTKLAPGIEGKKEIIITPGLLATAHCSGTLEVFATPAMIALMEQTAMESVADLLPEGSTTVGTEVSVKHFKATLPGNKVSFKSKVIEAGAKKIVFEVEASDVNGLIGKGIHTRYIVDKQSFIDNLK